MGLLLWVRWPTLLMLWWKGISTRRRAPAIKNHRRTLIVFRLDALGDLILTTPLFRELKRNFPDSHLTVVAQAAFRPVLITNPHIDEVLSVEPFAVRRFPLPGGLRRLLAALDFYDQKLHGRHFDIAISPRWDTDEHLATMLCLMTSASLRVGYSERTSAGKQRFNRGFDRVFDCCLPAGPLQHEVQRNLAMVEALGGKVGDGAPEIYLTAEDCEYAARTLQAVPRECLLIALGIGAQSAGRRWPLYRYATLILELGMRLPVRTIITCAPAEHGEAARLTKMIQREPIISDGAEIRETCALLAQCDLFIGNDTGAAHMAAAMGCPTIVISRHPRSGDAAHPNSPRRFAPYGTATRVLQPEQGLPGCTTRCEQIEPHCINQISVPQVLAAVHAMLNGRTPTASIFQTDLV